MSVPTIQTSCILVNLLTNPGQSPIAEGILRHCNEVGLFCLRFTCNSFQQQIPKPVLTYGLCSAAAQRGYVNVLKLARGHDCWWDFKTCYFAAKNGHLEVLKWARKNGCDWDMSTCICAEKYGHIEVLIWALKNGCDWNSLSIERGIAKKKSEMLQRMRGRMTLDNLIQGNISFGAFCSFCVLIVLSAVLIYLYIILLVHVYPWFE